MRTPITFPTLIACLLLLALPAASAYANAADDRIVHDCESSPTGTLTGTYPKAQLNHALHNLPSDVSEYSGCYDAIRQALIASAGRGASNGGNGTNGSSAGGIGGSGPNATGGGNALGRTAAGGVGAPATANAKPPAGAEQPVKLAGVAVAPGALPQLGRDSHRLPTALLVLLVLLGLAALVPSALTIGRRVVARRGA
jgi:hypothetical protein